MIGLLAAGADAPRVHPEVEFISVRSGYEAAAEMLAAPASALVVDLGRITPVHLPLLALADRLAVPVVAFGTVSAGLPAEQLRRLRMVPADRVAGALRELLRLPAAEPAPPEPTARPAPARLQPRTTRKVAEALTQAELDALLGESP